MTISFAGSEVVSLFLEATLYGLYAMLFGQSLRVIIHPKRSKRTNIRMVIVSVLLFMLITWHIFTDLVRLVLALQNSEAVANVAAIFGDAKSLFSVMKTAIYVGVTAVSDTFIVYRCYVVWNKDFRVIILPAVLYLADIGAGIAATVTLSELPLGQPYYIQRQFRVTETFFATTLALNGLCTVLIAYRVWSHQRAMSIAMPNMKGPQNLNRVAVIVVESALNTIGAIYVAALIGMIAMYTSEITVAFNVFLDIGITLHLTASNRVMALFFDPTIVSPGLPPQKQLEVRMESNWATYAAFGSTRNTQQILAITSTRLDTDVAEKGQGEAQEKNIVMV
ncbi:uncharacterized protein STEHIDRAFT_112681 [Stereum hirsutum FP-91666 SS1]|uniref:uncharacterized protein n=1 Tax=Stereum hirsutum (strain FP-91666) TaxID=721885 RepID=UPI00044493F6|nr:uncharacterized protein STEHIDRAFT_112681 [Stereum hirsutum FP-91666 SS1]EIM84250.1 hypothetical protein STEHIDRAFT_112681 [Stereum hirsutum FP-91666 SS1]